MEEQPVRAAAVTSWDVGSWAFGPARPYRINTLYRLDGAVVTLSGRVETTDAAADLAAALHVFEPLGAPLYVDLCHAVLGPPAADAVVEARRRRERGTGMPLVVRHATPASRTLIDRAAGSLLSRYDPSSRHPA